MIEDMQPGRYRTRDGQLAIVSLPAWTSRNCWVGRIDNDVHAWNEHGRLCCSNGQDSPLDLVARLPDEPPADDRIERALQVLREAQTWDWRDGGRDGGLVLQKVDDSGEWVRVEVLSELRKILEGQE